MIHQAYYIVPAGPALGNPLAKCGPGINIASQLFPPAVEGKQLFITRGKTNIVEGGSIRSDRFWSLAASHIGKALHMLQKDGYASQLFTLPGCNATLLQQLANLNALRR